MFSIFRRFQIEETQCTLEFLDALQTALLNGRPFKVEFGGLPKPVLVNDKKHFIRFSVLPRGFRAGYVRITGMRGEQAKSAPETSQRQDAAMSSLAPANPGVLPGLDLDAASGAKPGEQIFRSFLLVGWFSWVFLALLEPEILVKSQLFFRAILLETMKYMLYFPILPRNRATKSTFFK